MSVPLLVTILTYVAVGHPATYKTTSGLLGSWVASSDGLPKVGGLFLHAIVFILLAGLLLTLTMPKKSGFEVTAFGQKLTVGTQPTQQSSTPAQ
jgi:hypothetical protein